MDIFRTKIQILSGFALLWIQKAKTNIALPNRRCMHTYVALEYILLVLRDKSQELKTRKNY